MTRTKDQINELEAHLEKYGYMIPKGIKLMQLLMGRGGWPIMHISLAPPDPGFSPWANNILQTVIKTRS